MKRSEFFDLIANPSLTLPELIREMAHIHNDYFHYIKFYKDLKGKNIHPTERIKHLEQRINFLRNRKHNFLFNYLAF